MSKAHLKRLTIPESWPISKKGIKFVTRPNPGPHSTKVSMPLNLILKEMLNYAKNNREVKTILFNRGVFVDGKRINDYRHAVGLLDSIEIPEIKKCFRVIIDKKEKIKLVEIEKKEAIIKLCKINNKTKVKGKTQLNLYDGRNIFVDNDDYKTGDSLVLELPKQEIKGHIRLDKNKLVYLIGGKHTGEFGTIIGISSNKITYKREDGETIETLKKYAFVIGEDKPAIKIRQ